jgi:hypothetical protein
MNDKVIVKVFSGDTQLSCKEYDMNGYYDNDLPEIDDSDYITEHKIDRVEQHFYYGSEHIIRINYYNDKGSPYRFDEIKNGICKTEEL